MTTRVLFVCSGNVCRSPTAEAVFRHRAAAAGQDIGADSAGTNGYHIGDPPDLRAQAHARRRGYDLSDQRARRITAGDFRDFDLLIGMDGGHVAQLRRLAPRGGADKIRLFLDYAPGPRGRDVPDPYYGDAEDFEQVLDLVEAGVDGLLDHLRAGRPL